MNGLAIFLASVAYSGYAPIAPGTFGSAAALVVYAAVRWFDAAWIDAPLIAALFVVGIWASSRTARHLGRTDPGVVVIDEVVGMLISMAYLNLSGPGVLMAFLAFRVLDIIKPFPAAQSERLPGGFGIMVDDVLAGLYAQLFMRLLVWLAPTWFLR
jgi:phosphatidylglycerophosphatase A